MRTGMRDIDAMFGAMDLLKSRMDRLFYDYGRTWKTTPSYTLTAGSPRTNLLETGDGFEIQAEVPGLDKEELSIKVQGNYLEISGTRNQNVPEGYKVHRNERGEAAFSRSFTLPDDVDAEQVEAQLKEGILYLKLPKAEAAKPRQITVN